ncbi:MFS transporter [Streptomyces sp. NPDC088674]|uniref:MFS transporter n=1 Tax=Streptomyces sp. NPDC088674 TaxID=3365869 RepID=UPI00380FB3B2
MPDAAPATELPLRANRAFHLLWSGSALSVLGLEVADVVWPLVILAVTGSPASAGVFSAVQLCTALVLGLPAGELADRVDRRLLMMAVEAVRAVSVGSVAVALLLDELSLTHLLVVAVVIGAARPVSATCRMLMVRAVVPRSQLTTALTTEEVRNNAASLVGPALGGALYGASRALPFGVMVAAFVLSALCVLLVRLRPGESATPPRREEGPRLRQLTKGLAVLWSSPDLRGTTLFTAAMNTATAPLVLIVAVHLTAQKASSGEIGIAVAGLAVGGLIGSALIKPLRRFSPPLLMFSQLLVLAGLLCLMGLPIGPWWTGLLLVVIMLGVPTMRILADLVIFRQVPDEQRGRVMSAAGTLWGLGAAAGTLAAGLALDFFSARATLLAIAGALALVFLAGLFSPAFRGIRWPSDVD